MGITVEAMNSVSFWLPSFVADKVIVACTSARKAKTATHYWPIAASTYVIPDILLK